MPPAPRGFAVREIVLVLTIVAGFAVAAGTVLYRKARQDSIDKAVMCPIRQLAAAADQYYLENGVSTVHLDQLVGATNYIKALNTVAGETYPTFYTQGRTFTVTGVAGARTITYAP
ncbi:MAG: pilus assembly protein [Opitutaceae bacterium]|nr:pilus assembly protein [Opitutaceae bacterium]